MIKKQTMHISFKMKPFSNRFAVSARLRACILVICSCINICEGILEAIQMAFDVWMQIYENKDARCERKT